MAKQKKKILTIGDLKTDKKYQVCTSCRIRHYENCGSCFGFGVYSGKPGGIVSAREAHIDVLQRDKVSPCPECRSTEKGLPKTTTAIGE